MALDDAKMKGKYGSLADLVAKHNELKDDFETEQGYLDALQSDMGTAQSDINTAESDIDALEAAIAITTDEFVAGSFAGATLYGKAIAVGAGPNAGTVNAAHGVTSPDLFVKIDGYLASGTTTRFVNSDDGTVLLAAHRDGDNIVLTSASNLSGYSGHIVIYYTKSA